MNVSHPFRVRRSRLLLLATFGCALVSAGAVELLASSASQVSLRSLERNPIPADAASRARGRALYAQHCASCHGPSGRGDGTAGHDLDPQPSDLSETVGKTDAQLFRKITRGRRPMPSFKKFLADEDRWHVINFLRELTRHDAEGSAR